MLRRKHQLLTFAKISNLSRDYQSPCNARFGNEEYYICIDSHWTSNCDQSKKVEIVVTIIARRVLISSICITVTRSVATISIG
jgi:hypothetical protein